MSRRHEKPKPRKPKYPIGTIAHYGPDDKVTTKIVAGVILGPDAEPVLQRFVGTNVRHDASVRARILAFFALHHTIKIVETEGNIGCPHEEGPDFPNGDDCPFCPWWKGKQGSGRKR